MERKSRPATLCSDDWLAAALDALAEAGIEGVKVLPLAQRLGVSRGSFYWHFRDRRDLLRSLLDYWERWSTDTVIEAVADRGAKSPRERLWVVMDKVLSEGLSQRELPIRAWALYDAEAARTVRRVDRKRLDTVTGLFREAGFSKDQAEARARLLADYLMGDPVVFARESVARTRKLARVRWKVLVDD